MLEDDDRWSLHGKADSRRFPIQYTMQYGRDLNCRERGWRYASHRRAAAGEGGGDDDDARGRGTARHIHGTKLTDDIEDLSCQSCMLFAHGNCLPSPPTREHRDSARISAASDTLIPGWISSIAQQRRFQPAPCPRRRYDLVDLRPQTSLMPSSMVRYPACFRPYQPCLFLSSFFTLIAGADRSVLSSFSSWSNCCVEYFNIAVWATRFWSSAELPSDDFADAMDSTFFDNSPSWLQKNSCFRLSKWAFIRIIASASWTCGDFPSYSHVAIEHILELIPGAAKFNLVSVH